MISKVGSIGGGRVKTAGAVEAANVLLQNPIAATAIASSVFGAVGGTIGGARRGSLMAQYQGEPKTTGAIEGGAKGMAEGLLMGAAVGAIAGTILNRKAATQLGKDLKAALVKKAAEPPKLKKPDTPRVLTKEEKKNLRKTVKLLKPKTRTEEQVREITGRPLTKGQLARYGVIGAGSGAIGSIASGLITGAPLTVRRAVASGVEPQVAKSVAILAPRRLTASGAYGATLGLGMDAMKRIADREAAFRGKF